jgi:hypothetical protein
VDRRDDCVEVDMVNECCGSDGREGHIELVV